MVEAIPLAVTSFLPVVLFPLLGVQDTCKWIQIEALIYGLAESECNVIFEAM